MKKNEKELIYNILKTSNDYLNSYKSYEQMPSFTDSIKKDKIAYKTNENLTLEKIKNKVSNCKNCHLYKTRNKPVTGEGPSDKSKIFVMVVGEAPGGDEDRIGKPFVGKAGQLLEKMLAAINLYRNENCYITNILKCRPPNNRDPEIEEINKCIHFLESQIEIIKPKLILCLGRFAAQTLLKTTDGINHLRGKFYYYKGIPLMPIYHPSYLLHNEGQKRPAWEDLKLFQQKILELKSEEL